MSTTQRICCLLLLLATIIGVDVRANAYVSQLGPDSGIPVGVLYPGSGALSASGASSYVAFQSALTDLNAYLSQNGYGLSLKLLLYDSGSSPEGALAGLQELDSLGINLVIGPFTSAQCEMALPYANANDILLLSPTGTAPSLAQEGDNLMCLSLNDTYQALAIADLMWEEGRRVYLPVWRGDTWGDELESLVASDFAALGGTVLGGIRYDVDRMNSSDLLAQLNDMVVQAAGTYGASKVAVNLVTFEEGIDVLAGAGSWPTLSQVGWYGSDGTARNQALLDNAQAAAFAGLAGFSSPMLYESVETSTTPRLVLTDIVLREELAASLGGSPSSGTYQAWDAVWLAGLGYASGGVSADASQLRQAVADQAHDYVGMSGMLRLDQAGDRDYGSYGFFKVSANGSSYTYKLSATYASAYGSADGLKIVSPWDPPSLSDAPAVYQVGVLLNSGDSTEGASTSMLAGLKQAVEAINTHFSLYGYPTRLELLTYDTGGDTNKAIDGLKSLAGQGVKTIIGPLTNSESAAVLSLANELGVMLVSPGSDATSLSIAGDNLYRVVPDLQAQGEAMAALMWQQGRKALTCIYLDDMGSRELAEATAQAFQSLGGVVLGQVSYTADSGSYDKALAAAEQYLNNASGQYGKDQLAVQLSGMEEGISLLGQTAGHSGLTQAYWYGSERLSDSPDLLGSGTAAAFASSTNLTTIRYATDITGLVAGIPKSLPLLALSAELESSQGSKPQSYAYTAYDGLWMVALATLDSDWSSSASTLGTQFATTSKGYTGLSNALTLNSNGDRKLGNYDFLTPSAGNWSTIYTYYDNPATGVGKLISH